MREAQVVRTPFVEMTSLTATGTPASGDKGSLAATLRSIFSAWARARSGESVRYARMALFSRSIRSSVARTSSSAENWRARSPA